MKWHDEGDEARQRDRVNGRQKRVREIEWERGREGARRDQRETERASKGDPSRLEVAKG